MSEAERSVEQARGIRLDPNRQRAALRRIRAAREVLAHHESMAAAERGKIATLMRTWKLCPAEDAVEASLHGTEVECCQNPEACKLSPASASEG